MLNLCERFFIVAGILATDYAVSPDNESGRQTGNTIRVGALVLLVKSDNKAQRNLLQKRGYVFFRRIYADADDLKAIVAVFFIQFVKFGQFLFAGNAPGCPEIEEHHLTFKLL